MTRFTRVRALTIACALAQLPALAAAQALPPATPGYVPARTPDGQPNIQGFWQSVPGGSYSIENLEAQAIYQQNRRDPTREGKSRIIDPANGRIRTSRGPRSSPRSISTCTSIRRGRNSSMRLRGASFRVCRARCIRGNTRYSSNPGTWCS